MGKGRKGGRSPSEFKFKEIHRRIASSKLAHRPLDELVHDLRAKYHDYSRQKLHPFTNLVREALESSYQSSVTKRVRESEGWRALSFQDDSEVEEVPSVSSSRKRLKKLDEAEERLKRMDNNHVRNQRGSCSSGISSTESDSGDEKDEDDADEGVSTSEDAIYKEKVEPEFDITKSLLLSSYQKPTKPQEKAKAKAKFEENIMEVESGSNKKWNILNDVVTCGVAANNDDSVKVRDGGKIGMAVKDKEGPWFKDLGGIKSVLEKLKMDVLVPLYHPQLPRELGVRPMAGILLHGPPGCGKTKLARAIANEAGVPFYEISATEVVSGVSGASEENIRNLFSKAYRTAPSVVFIDEIDAIASKRENLQREMERRIVTQLMTCMDESCRSLKPNDNSPDWETSPSHSEPGYVLVIGATNRPDAVDSALRRPGRFDAEIVLGVPDEESRAEILSVLTHSLKRDDFFDLQKIARATPGYVGADMAALANKAGILAMKRIIDKRKLELYESFTDVESAGEWWKQPWSPEEIEKLSITMADFEKAIGMIQPSSTREGFSAIPNVKWQDVGGLDPLKQAFDRYIVRRIKYPEEYEGFGVDLETGFLLFGPPGCGKTLIAKAVANAAGVNFIHIKGPELLTKYVGDSELAVRTLFSRARTCAPCILFFDEVDALTKQRGTEGGWVVERLLNQLLIELDGADHRRGVFVIGATNRIEVIDSALLRPGRFGKLHYVRLPSPEERCRILEAFCRNKPIDPDVDLESIGRMQACENFSGADLAALMNEAAMIALEEKLGTARNSPNAAGTIKTRHFELALDNISPSVSPMDIQVYERLAKEYKSA